MSDGTCLDHCCARHGGCKYRKPDCPVETGRAVQRYTCEICDSDREDIEEMLGFLDTVQGLEVLGPQLATQISELVIPSTESEPLNLRDRLQKLSELAAAAAQELK